MKVIVSSELKDNFNNFLVVKDFSSISPEGISALVLHKCSGISDFEVGVAVSNLYSAGVKTFVYINSDPSTNIKSVVRNVGGFICDDEFYLEDEEELNSLLEELISDKYNNNSLVLSSTQIVKDFIGAFSRHEERIQAPLYLEQVSQAVNELSELTHKQELQIKEMGVSATEVYKKASSMIDAMNEQKKVLEKQLEEFEENQASVTMSRSSSFSSSISFFPTFRYVGTSKVLNIREFTPCRYLTSFLLGYTHHIHYELNKRVKFIIVHQKGKRVSDRYSKFTSITQESADRYQLYENEIIATNNPKKDVMQRLTHSNDDVIIVLDRTYGQDILSGKVVTLNALGGYGDVDRFKLNPDTCIFSITAQANEFFHIPLIKNYAKEVDMRHASYAQLCREHFEKLDSLLDLR